MSVVRMRTPAQALVEIKQQDPHSCVSLNMIRRLIKTGAVPSIAVCSGRRRLVSLDALLVYLENPPENKSTVAMQGIRPVPESLKTVR